MWTTVQGLPQGSVLAIAQTKDGYLWFGTRAGLVRFNGQTFTVFDPRQFPLLGGGTIQSLLAGRDGSLWIGTDGKGLVRHKAGEFSRLEQPPELLADSGNGFYLDEAGTLWVATWMGVLRVDREGVTRIDSQMGLPHDTVFSVAGNGHGVVWAATTDGLVEIRDGKPRRAFEELQLIVPRCLLYDRSGRLWIGTAAGLHFVEGGRATLLTARDGLLADFVTALAEDRDGNIWIGTEGGLNRWHNGHLAAYSTEDGLPGDSVATLMEDREGSLWIGLRGTGLVRLRDGPLVTYTRHEGLAGDNVTCIYESSDGSLWLGTTHGLTRFHGGKLTTFTSRDGLLNESINGLGEDPRYGLIIATYHRRLNTYRNGRIGELPAPRISSTVPSIIHRDKRGALWIGTLGEGLYRLDDHGVTHFPFARSSGRYVIYAAYEDADGVLWFATPNGLLRYEDGDFSVVTVYPQLPNLGVAYGLLGDAHGNMWAATRDRGLCRLRKGEETRCYGRAEGFFDDTVYRVLEDDSGRLFLSTPLGIGVVTRQTLEAFDRGEVKQVTALRLGVEDGMKAAECQGTRWPAGWKASDGRLWFPTMKGAVVVDPRRLDVSRPPPPVVLERLSANGEVRPLESSVVVPPGRGDVEIAYAGLSYRMPELLRFRYRLDGFDDGWVEAGARRVAHYTNIPPGRYRFRVTAAQQGGEWNPREASVGIRLAPHFYETGIWRAGVVAMALCLVWLGYRFRLRQLNARAHELTRKVTEALASAKVLSGMLPICASCKRVRSDKGYWEQIEAYIRTHSEADFSHGLCPECLRTLYPDMAEEVLSDSQGESRSELPDANGPPEPGSAG